LQFDYFTGLDWIVGLDEKINPSKKYNFIHFLKKYTSIIII